MLKVRYDRLRKVDVVFLSVRVCVCLSIYLSIYLSVFPSIYLPVFLVAEIPGAK